MKPSICGVVKCVLLSLSLAATWVCYGQPSVIVGPIINWGPPPGAVFPPTFPTLESDDVAIDYHYARMGTGYWTHDLPAEQAIIDLVAGAEEWTTHYKTNGVQVTPSHGYAFHGFFRRMFCEDWQYLTVTNTCDTTNGTCPMCVPWSTGFADGEDFYTLDPEGYAYSLCDSAEASPYYTGVRDIKQSLTTTNTGCGTLTTGTSGYETDLPPGDFCQCIHICWDPADKLVPNEYYAGKGGIYQIDLHITPDCTPDPSPFNPPVTTDPSTHVANAVPLASVTMITGSAHPLTPTNGTFNGSGNFVFNFVAPSSDSYTIYASTDLQLWTLLTQVTASGVSTFTDSSSSSLTKRFYAVVKGAYTSAAQVNPSDAYGFVKVTVPTSGAIITDPFLSDNGMSIGSVLPSMPNGTTAESWNGVGWDPPATFSTSTGTWDDPDVQISPGSGVFLKPSSSVTIRFAGQVVLGTSIMNFIHSGCNLRSSALPLTGTLTSLGLNGSTVAIGDYVQRWNGTGFTSYTNTSFGWRPSDPSINLCEGFLITSATNTSWKQSFTMPGILNASVTTVAGDPGAGGTYGGDGGPALSASFEGPLGIVLDSSGNLYIADSGNSVVREVSVSDGNIYDICDGSTIFGTPCGVVFDTSGNLYVADRDADGIYEISGWPTYTSLGAGDDEAQSLAIDGSGNLYCVNGDENIVTKIDPSGNVVTVAGNGIAGFSGDGGAATDASLAVNAYVGGTGSLIRPSAAVDSFGNIYIADMGNSVIRKVDTSGYISTVAGDHNLAAGYSGDEGPATSAQLSKPSAVAVDSAGNLYIADTGNHVIRRVDVNGIITTVAGNGQAGCFSGAANLATLNAPSGLAFDASGNLYISDAGNNVVRKLTLNP